LEVSETILRFALSKLSKDELQEVFTEINKIVDEILEEHFDCKNDKDEEKIS
jgi:cell fate (sporulation/competence/biofilm development) regulator YlbF (YheA/YmcA/DUF963 family)